MLPEGPPIRYAVHIVQNKKIYVIKSPKMCQYSVGNPEKNHRTLLYWNFIVIVMKFICHKYESHKIALFALAQIAEMGRANALQPNKMQIFDFFENNAQSFWWWNLLCE